MIKSPIGNVHISINEEEIEYKYRLCKESLEKYKNLNACYFIEIPINNLENIETISISIDNQNIVGLVESGEDFEALSFYGNDIKLTLGGLGDFHTDNFDYSGYYGRNSISYKIHTSTRTKIYYFTIAWLNNVNEDNEIETWLATDPALYI